jgi:hypothetical protein
VDGSTAAASCLKAPSASRRFAATMPCGSHSQTLPADEVAPPRIESSNSSQDSQVPQGVAPPAQLVRVFLSTALAATIFPEALKRIPLAPPSRWGGSGMRLSVDGVSLLTTSTQPAPLGKQCAPSGKIGHG